MHTPPQSSDSESFVDITIEERVKQLNDLKKRLDAMEEEIVEQERQTRVQQQQQNDSTNKKPCWFFKCLSTSDIKTDIPGRFQRSVYNMHHLWVFSSFTLIFNWFAMLMWNGFDGITSRFIMPSLFVLIGIPGGYYGWYRRFFIAICYGSHTKFMIFNVNFSIHLIFVSVMCLGFTKLNSAGVILMVKEIINDHGVTEYSVIISTIMWIIDIIASLILFKKCFRTHTLIQ
eukprot:UN09620